MHKDIPAWVMRYKRKGVEIRRIGSNYYAYERTSRWDPTTKRPKKITGEYLGRVTEKGIVPPKHKRVRPVRAILEHGNILLLHNFSRPLEPLLREHFEDDADTLLAASALRAAYQAPLKNLKFLYDTSTAHKFWPGADMDGEAMTQLLRRVGMDWGAQLDMYRGLSKGKKYAAIDLTQIFSASENIHWLEKGYNAAGVWHDQLQLLLLHSLGRKPQPTFLKLLPESIRDAKTLANAVWEADLECVILVSDKAFYSEGNLLNALERRGLSYLIALKRNHSGLRYAPESKYGTYFRYRDRFIWAREYPWRGRRILHFLDKKLRAEEETTFLRLVEEGRRRRFKLTEVGPQFGTLAMVTDTDLPPDDAYSLYKQRIEVEVAFDALKNQLEADKSYMRSRESIAGYYFIIFLSLFLYTSILNHLRKKELVSKYSVRDVLVHLSKVYKVVIGNEERTSEIPKKVRTLVQKLGIPMT